MTTNVMSTNEEDTQVILVVGATGAQGGAVVDALLRAGRTVRALVRDETSPAARQLAARGVDLRIGTFDDPAAVRAAVTGADGVFSMQMPPHPRDLDSERRAAALLVRASVDAGVRQIVHSSVARADDHENFIGWTEQRWWPGYWLGKAAANDAVRSGALDHWTILKPAFMMDNFIPPKVDSMFPRMRSGFITTAMSPQTRLDLIAAADIGRVAAAVFDDTSGRYHHRELDLAAESLTMSEVAATISAVTGSAVAAQHVSAEDAVAAGTHRGVVENQLWASAEGYRVDSAQARGHGVPLQSFRDWAADHAAQFAVPAQPS